MNSNRASGLPRCRGVSRRAFLADCGMGFTGLALGAMLHRDGVARADASAGWSPPDGRPALRPQGQERHLAVHDRRHQPHGELRPQARAEQVRRQDDRRDARTRTSLDSPHAQAESSASVVADDCTTVQPQRSYPLQVGFRKRGQSGHRGQRLVAPPGRLHRRHRRRPLDVDDRQQPRRPAPVPHRPAHARGRSSPRSARGSTTASARSTTTCRSSSSWARRSPTAAAASEATARTTSAPSTTASSWPSTRRTRSPSPRPGRTSTARSSRREFELLGRLNRLSAVEYPDDPALRRPDQVVRAGLPHADRRPRGAPLRARRPSDAGASTASTRRRRSTFGEQCLAARRLVERGVRFVQVFHGSNGGAGAWDAHGGLKAEPLDALRPGRPADRRAAEGPEAARPARRDARRLGAPSSAGRPARRGATAATTTPTASRSGWPAAGSRAASPTARPTSWASTPSRTATTSPTSTPPSCTSWASTRAGSRSPASKRLEIDYGKPIREIIA